MSKIEEAVIQKIKDRMQKGLQKYGATMARSDLAIEKWIEHAIEENLDSAIYLEKIRQTLIESDETKRTH